MKTIISNYMRRNNIYGAIAHSELSKVNKVLGCIYTAVGAATIGAAIGYIEADIMTNNGKTVKSVMSKTKVMCKKIAQTTVEYAKETVRK